MYCKRYDCKYNRFLNNVVYKGVVACHYCYDTFKIRGCSIEECDKYEPLDNKQKKAYSKYKSNMGVRPRMSLLNVIEKRYNKSAREIIREMYIDKEMNIKTIAEELGVSVPTVYRWISKFNLTRKRVK